MAYTVLGTLAVYAGRVLLDHYTNLATLGVYSVFLTFALQLNGVWNSFNRAWTPETFAALNADRDRAIGRISRMITFFTAVYLTGVIVLMVVCRPIVLSAILGPQYVSQINVPVQFSFWPRCLPLSTRLPTRSTTMNGRPLGSCLFRCPSPFSISECRCS